LTDGTHSLITNANMISKVYFPRLILPLSAVAGKLVDFSIGLCVMALLMAWFHFQPAAAASRVADDEYVVAQESTPTAGAVAPASDEDQVQPSWRFSWHCRWLSC
jgi:hypothetical protein